MAAEVPTIPLLTPYKLGKFNLSHRCAPCKVFFFFFYFFSSYFCLFLRSELSLYVMGFVRFLVSIMLWVLFYLPIILFVFLVAIIIILFVKNPSFCICSSVRALLIGVCLCFFFVTSSLISMFRKREKKGVCKNLFPFTIKSVLLLERGH